MQPCHRRNLHLLYILCRDGIFWNLYMEDIHNNWSHYIHREMYRIAWQLLCYKEHETKITNWSLTVASPSLSLERETPYAPTGLDLDWTLQIRRRGVFGWIIPPPLRLINFDLAWFSLVDRCASKERREEIIGDGWLTQRRPRRKITRMADN